MSRRKEFRVGGVVEWFDRSVRRRAESAPSAADAGTGLGNEGEDLCIDTEKRDIPRKCETRTILAQGRACGRRDSEQAHPRDEGL